MGNFLSVIFAGIVVWAIFVFLGDPWPSKHATLVFRPPGATMAADSISLPDKMQVSSIERRRDD